MQKTTNSLRKMCVAAGILVLASYAAALVPEDAQIKIDRALNSPTLTIRYEGAKVALVEMRLNGESLGTRSVSSAKDSGETNFTLDLNALKDGDNEVEIRLFDRTGKLVGSDKTKVSTDQGNTGPVFLSLPKVGATVMGDVEINVGFGRELKNTYVSFFIDEQFKSMTNYPPYTYIWDTAREANGWHELQAWVVDDRNETFKTRKVRVFVNNPGGRTDRKGAPTNELSPSKNPIRTGAVGTEAGPKTGPAKGGAVASEGQLQGTAPKVSANLVGNPVRGGQLGAPSHTKAGPTAPLSVTGVRNLTPTGVRLAPLPKPIVPTVPVVKTALPALPKPVATKTAPAKVQPAKTVVVTKTIPTTVVKVDVKPTGPIQQVAAASTLVPITKGQRIPNLTTFAVVLNNEFVNFDVAPRVDEGVPMTPFRHLIEKAGGKVDWENLTKSVKADAEGRIISLQIGDANARIDNLSVSLEIAPYLDRGRTIVPLSFIREALNVNVEYDKATGHVLVTTVKK